jgi:DNA invertase Pin-like site-specific DNA recombinase
MALQVASRTNSPLPLDIYLRVSRVNGRDGDSFISPAVQEERCRALAVARGHDVGEVISDLDVSGGTMDRPGLNTAIGRIREGTSGGIIVARVDRFARTLPGALRVIEDIESSGGVLVEADGNWDTSTSMGRFARDLVLRLAQLYREQVGEQWDDAKRKAVERGVHPTAHVPFGYTRARGRAMEPDPKTADHVRRLFELRAHGASWRELCDHLEANNIGPPRAARWTITSVRQIVGNPAYRGEARMAGHVNPEGHEAIVTRALWRAAQVEHPKRAVRGTEGARLAGIVFCASCGGRLTPVLPVERERKPRRGRGLPTVERGPGRYKCRSRNAAANTGCAAPGSARMDELDSFVVQAFVDRYREAVGQLDDEPREVRDPEQVALTREHERARGVLDDLLADTESLGALSPENRATLLRNAQEAVDAAGAALDAHEVRVETSVLNVWTLGDHFEPDGFVELPIPEQRRLLRMGIRRVVVARGRRMEPVDGRTTIEWMDEAT